MSIKKIVIIALAMLVAGGVITYVLLSKPSEGVQTSERGPEGGALEENEAEGSREVKQLSIVVSMNDTEFAYFREYVEIYDQQHEELTLQVDNLPSEEAYERWKTGAQTGETSDIILLDNTWVNELAALGLLSQQAEKFIPDLEESDRLEVMASQLKWNGYLWAVPKDVDPYVLIWNKSVMKPFEEDHPPGSGEELISANRWLTGVNRDNVGIYFDPEDPYAFISLVWSLGGEWVDPESKEALIASPETVALLRSFYGINVTEQVEGEENTDRKDEDRIQPMSFPSDQWDPWEKLTNGDIGAMIARYSDYRRHSLVSDKLNMSPLPYTKKDDLSYGPWIYGRSFAVFSKSKHQEEAFSFIREFTTDSAQQRFMQAGGGLPVNITAYATSWLKSDDSVRDLARTLEWGRVFPTDPYGPDKIRMLKEEIARFCSGQEQLGAFAKRIAGFWNEAGR